MTSGPWCLPRPKPCFRPATPACSEFQTFIITPEGRAEAQAGCHDDWVAGIGIGLVVSCYSVLQPSAPIRDLQQNGGYSFRPSGRSGPMSGAYGRGALG